MLGRNGYGGMGKGGRAGGGWLGWGFGWRWEWSGMWWGGEKEKRRKLAEDGDAVRALEARRGGGKKSTKFFSVVSREGPSPSECP